MMEDFQPPLYKFGGKKWLSTLPPSCIYRKVYICMYDVHMEGKNPFQRFLLASSNGRLVFPHIVSMEDNPLEEIHAYVNSVLKVNITDLYEGFYEYEENIYCFIDVTSCKLYQQLDECLTSSRQWFALIDEILNHNKICNIAIEHQVTDFFLFNEDFCFLLDAADQSYELPIVAYTTKEIHKLNFTQVFGQPKSMDLYGEYYYFSDYWSCFEKEDEKVDGLVRFAIFLGNTRYVENMESDPLDVSSIKREKLTEEEMAGETNGFEHKTIRITDYDGKWADSYDSLFLGNLLLNNGELLKNSMIVIKNYSQQVPLSIHLIKNKKDYSIV